MFEKIKNPSNVKRLMMTPDRNATIIKERNNS